MPKSDAVVAPSSNPARPWNVGQALRSARAQQGKSLRDLSEATRLDDPEHKGVLPAQISRIENGLIIPDLRELMLLCKSLALSPEKILNSDLIPWFVVRRDRAHEILHAIELGHLTVKRQDNRHNHMLNKNVYKYVPLEDDLAIDTEREGRLLPSMRAFIFEVARASQDDVLTGLDRHPGEEIVIVMEGELEFWYKQDEKDHPRSVSLKAGDCIHYSSQLYHGYRASGKDQSAKAIFVFREQEGATPAEIRTTSAPE